MSVMVGVRVRVRVSPQQALGVCGHYGPGGCTQEMRNDPTYPSCLPWNMQQLDQEVAHRRRGTGHPPLRPLPPYKPRQVEGQGQGIKIRFSVKMNVRVRDRIGIATDRVDCKYKKRCSQFKEASSTLDKKA